MWRLRVGSSTTSLRRDSVLNYLFVAPGLIVYLVFVLGPFGADLWYSLHKWDGIGPSTFVGLENYLHIVKDPVLRSGLGHAGELAFFFAIVPTLTGLMLAAILGRRPVRGYAVFRSVLFLPQIIPTVVVAIVWTWFYQPQGQGSLNSLLRLIHVVHGVGPSWLGGFSTALPAVGVIGAWIEFGLCMVLFLAGIQRIDPNLFEAASLDGAGAVREFLSITMPAIRREIAVALTLTLIFSLRSFTIVYQSTGGGPGNATSVPAYLVYEYAFQLNQVGTAAAVGVVIAVSLFAISYVLRRVVEGKD